MTSSAQVSFMGEVLRWLETFTNCQCDVTFVTNVIAPERMRVCRFILA